MGPLEPLRKQSALSVQRASQQRRELQPALIARLGNTRPRLQQLLALATATATPTLLWAVALLLRASAMLAITVMAQRPAR